MDTLIANLTTEGLVIPLLLFAAFISGITYAVYRVLAAPQAAEQRVQDLLRELAIVTETLNEAEKIGHFGSFTWDTENSALSYWSEETYDIFGLVKRRSAPSIDVFLEVSPPEEKEHVALEWQKAKTRPGPFAFTFRTALHDGVTRHVRVQGTTTLGIDRQLARIHGAVHDITAEVEIDRSKTEFVSLASHQLKTPLTSIRWLVEALMSGSLGPLPTAQKAYVELVQESVQRMIDMVNDLLTASRIEMNKLARQIEELDAVAMVQSVIDEQKHDVETKHLSLVFNHDPAIPHLLADKNSLRMIFQNLISNAIKYTTPEGAVTCTMTVGGATQESLILTVADTGIGIPKAEHARVFEKLHRASNAQALVPEGTGLGLYVVKTVIERVGGGITFESVEGKGTTFYVTMPMRWPDAAPMSAPSAT